MHDRSAGGIPLAPALYSSEDRGKLRLFGRRWMAAIDLNCLGQDTDRRWKAGGSVGHDSKGLRRRLDPASVKLGDHERLSTRYGRAPRKRNWPRSSALVAPGTPRSNAKRFVRPLTLLKRLAAELDATPEERIMVLLLEIPESYATYCDAP